MNSIDAIAFGLVVVNCILGFVRGFLRMALGVVSFLVGALAAYIYYKNGASIVQACLVFTATTIVLNIAFWGLGKLFHKEGDTTSFASRLGGGAVGAFEGLVYVVAMLVLLYLSSGLLGKTNPALSSAMSESAAYARFVALSDSPEGNKLTQAQKMVESLRGPQPALTIDPKIARELQENPAIKEILNDKELMESIQARDYRKVLTNPKILRAIQDKDLLKKLTQKGIIKASHATQDAPQGNIPSVPEADNQIQ